MAATYIGLLLSYPWCFFHCLREGHFIDLHLCIFFSFFWWGLNIALHQFEWCVKFFLNYIIWSHISVLNPGTVTLALNQMGFQVSTLQTEWVLCLKIIAIEQCASFRILSSSFCARLFFSNRGNCSGRIHRNLRSCMDRDSEDQQLAHYQGIIMQPIYTCSLQG